MAVPPSSILKSDVTQFLATGLELRTDNEVVPIAVSYETIMGHFKLSPFNFPKYYRAADVSSSRTNSSSSSGEQSYYFSANFEKTPFHRELLKELEDEENKGEAAVEVADAGETLTFNANGTDGTRGASKYFVSENKANQNTFMLYQDDSRTETISIPASGDIIEVLKLSPILKQRKHDSLIKEDPYIDLMLKSTFGKNVEIASVTSCNSWFKVLFGRSGVQDNVSWKGVDGLHSNSDGSRDSALAYRNTVGIREEGIPVARLYHTLSCGGGETTSSQNNVSPQSAICTPLAIFLNQPLTQLLHIAKFSHFLLHTQSAPFMSSRQPRGFVGQAFRFTELSFWHCAQRWLSHRKTIQPSGCGPELSDKVTAEQRKLAVKGAAQAVDNLLRQQAVIDSDFPTKKQLRAWSEATRAWAKYSSLHLNVMGTSIRASPTLTEASSDTSLSMIPLVASSTLDMPALHMGMHSEVVFEDTNVGEVAAGFVYVENPTGSPVVVSLTNEAHDRDCYVQKTQNDYNSWFTGNGWSMQSHDPSNSILQVGYGSSFHTSSRKSFRHSVHGISMLLRGCARRCGLKEEPTTPTSLFAPIAPIGLENQEGSTYRVTKPQPFAISYDGHAKARLEPYERKRLGPIFFRPWGPGDFKADIYIKNDCTLFEKVSLLGRGVAEQMSFAGVGRDSQEMKDVGGISAMMFPAGADTESESDRGETVRTIRVRNDGGTELNVEKFYLSSSHAAALELEKNWGKAVEEMLIKFDRKMPTFPVFGYAYRFLRYCIVTSTLRLCPRPIAAIISKAYHETFSLEKLGNILSWSNRGCDSRGFRILGCRGNDRANGFVLRPGEHIDLSIEHVADCTFSTFFVYLVFDLRKERLNRIYLFKEFHTKKVQMMVGYDASVEEMENCKLGRNLQQRVVAHKIFFILLVVVFLYWLAVEVLNRHDHMLRFDETYNSPKESLCGYHDDKMEVEFLARSNASVLQLTARMSEICRDITRKRGIFGRNTATVTTRKVAENKKWSTSPRSPSRSGQQEVTQSGKGSRPSNCRLRNGILPEGMFGLLEDYGTRRGTNFIPENGSLKLNLDAVKGSSAFKEMVSATAKAKSGSFVDALVERRGGSKEKIGMMDENEFAEALKVLTACRKNDRGRYGKAAKKGPVQSSDSSNSAKSVTFNLDSRDGDDAASSKKNGQVKSTPIVKTLSKAERKALAAQQQMLAQEAKRARLMEIEEQKKQAMAQKKEKRESEEKEKRIKARAEQARRATTGGAPAASACKVDPMTVIISPHHRNKDEEASNNGPITAVKGKAKNAEGRSGAKERFTTVTSPPPAEIAGDEAFPLSQAAATEEEKKLSISSGAALKVDGDAAERVLEERSTKTPKSKHAPGLAVPLNIQQEYSEEEYKMREAPSLHASDECTRDTKLGNGGEEELESSRREEKEKLVAREQQEVVDRVSDVILSQKGVAEVSWLIQASREPSMGIMGYFSAPSDVARFCVMNEAYELRREGSVDFIVMKSVLPEFNRFKHTEDASLANYSNDSGGGRNDLPLQGLPLPPPGISGSHTSLAGSALGAALPMPAADVGGDLIVGRSFGSGGLPSLESLLRPESIIIGDVHGASPKAASGDHSAGVKNEIVSSSESMASSADGFDLNELLPTDIADFVMEEDEEDIWAGGTYENPYIAPENGLTEFLNPNDLVSSAEKDGKNGNGSNASFSPEHLLMGLRESNSSSKESNKKKAFKGSTLFG